MDGTSPQMRESPRVGRNGEVLITVDRLVHDCEIEMAFLAGEEGRVRPLLWAHVIDVSDPWNWIGRGELILTTGAGIPHEASQSEWMRNVIDSGANGLVLASGPGTVGLSPAALACADDARFPVLSASFTAKFTELAKEVINVALQQDAQRLAAAQRVFSVYSTALTREESLERRLTGVARRVGLRFVIKDSSEVTMFTNAGSEDSDAETVALDSWIEPLRLTLGLWGGDSKLLGPSLRYSFALITGIELHRQINREMERSVLAESQLQTLTRSGIDEDVAMNALVRSTLDGAGEIVVIAVDQAAQSSFELIRLSPHLWNAPALAMIHRGMPLIVCEDSAETLSEVERALGEHSAGVSNPWHADLKFGEALMQARTAGRQVKLGLTRFRDLGPDSSLLPVGTDQQRQLAGQALGPISTYDSAHGTELLETLNAYYSHDRSPGRAADTLFIHRHTLTYRLKTIEKITGMNPNSTNSIVHLGAALEAARNTGWLGLKA